MSIWIFVCSRCDLANSCSYIKELAERLNTLEGAVQAGQLGENGQYPPRLESPHGRASEEYSPQDRKRDYSSISGDYGTPLPYHNQRVSSGGWVQPEREPARLLSTFQPAPSSSVIFHDQQETHTTNDQRGVIHWRAPKPEFPNSVENEQVEMDNGAPPEWKEDMLDP